MTLSGTPTLGQTLTASSTLVDSDGPSTLALSYEWHANGVTIPGASVSTLELGQELVGKSIDVSARYTDAFGAIESKASSATPTVTNLNDAPTAEASLSLAARPKARA